MWNQLILLFLLAGAALAGGMAVGVYRWDRRTRALRKRLRASRSAMSPPRVDFAELAGLPAPVQAYFQAVLEDGQPMVAELRIRHRGMLNLGNEADRWRAFRSDQQVITQPPGFNWEARMWMTSGVPVRVHDAYVAGEGILQASIFGWYPVADFKDTERLAEGELMRFLAEAAWYPTALLPSQGVRWDAVDDRSAQATLPDGPATVTLRFTFDQEGLIESVYAAARARLAGDGIVLTPWEVRLRTYQPHSRMRIPFDGEVAWLTEEGRKPYWRGRITQLDYEPGA